MNKVSNYRDNNQLLQIPFQSNPNNYFCEQTLKDQCYQTEQQQFHSSKNPLNQIYQYVEQPQYKQNQHCLQGNCFDCQQINNVGLCSFKSMSFQQEQSYIYNPQEVLQNEEFEQNNYQESVADDNLSITHSNQSNSNSNYSLAQNNQKSSQISIKTQETAKLIKKQEIPSSVACKKDINQMSSILPDDKIQEKSKQSISKNNIRNFLTPILRMKCKNIDNALFQKEKVTHKAFESFLKQHFYIPGSNKLKILQAKFDSLVNPDDKSQMKEKRVFAQIVIKNIQNIFMKLIVQKKSKFNDDDIYQSFEWINVINRSLIVYLNSTKCQN